MGIYDAVFWEKMPSNTLFNVLKSYKLRVIRLKPPLKKTLFDFFQEHSAGVLFTDTPEELEGLNNIVKSVFIVALLPDDPGEVTADVVLKKHQLNGSISMPLAKRVVQLVSKAGALAKINGIEEEPVELEVPLSEREKELYTLLKTYPQGLSVRQISSYLGWSQNMLRVYIMKLRKKGIGVVFTGQKYRIEEEVLI